MQCLQSKSMLCPRGYVFLGGGGGGCLGGGGGVYVLCGMCSGSKCPGVSVLGVSVWGVSVWGIMSGGVCPVTFRVDHCS